MVVLQNLWIHAHSDEQSQILLGTLFSVDVSDFISGFPTSPSHDSRQGQQHFRSHLAPFPNTTTRRDIYRQVVKQTRMKGYKERKRERNLNSFTCTDA